jgi:hypothetical protein
MERFRVVSGFPEVASLAFDNGLLFEKEIDESNPITHGENFRLRPRIAHRRRSTATPKSQ